MNRWGGCIFAACSFLTAFSAGASLCVAQNPFQPDDDFGNESLVDGGISDSTIPSPNFSDVVVDGGQYGCEQPCSSCMPQSCTGCWKCRRAPDAIGDGFLAGHLITLVADTPADQLVAGFGSTTDTRHARIALNNSATPSDRFSVVYQHFHNATPVALSAAGGQFLTNLDVNRYMIAWESSSDDGRSSVEIRMPFFDQRQLAVTGITSGATDYLYDSGTVGNLAVIFKQVVLARQQAVVSTGLSITTPTGDDTRGILPLAARSFVLQNQAVHFMPYLAISSTCLFEDFFYHAFLQLDVDANGNRIDIVDTGTGATSTGVLQDQTLVYADLSAGYVFFRNYDTCRSDRSLANAAGLLELHLMSPIDDTDLVGAFPPAGSPGFFNPGNKFERVSLTLGVHMELTSGTALRLGGTFPLRSSSSLGNRFYDAEVNFQLVTRPW